MKRRLFSVLSCFVMILSGALMPVKGGEKPNVLLILADDLGYHDLGFQGSSEVKTPRLDWLAEQSVRFTDGHVSSTVCSPSRAGLLTGRYQQRFGHEANCPRGKQGMSLKERTLGQAMKDAGYRTAVFGKWHLGATKEQYPTARGFDEFVGLREGGREYWYNDQKSDKAGNPHAIEHNGKQVPFEGHLTDYLADQAIRYIKAEDEKPFFIFLSFTAPHAPLQSKPEDGKGYYGLIQGMDRNIGKVIDVLKESGKLENTMIWFLSDNGGVCAAASNKPLGGKKGSEFEGGHRVPFLLYWKNHVPRGKDYKGLVSSLDIYATSLKAAGGSLQQELPLDGVDLIPFVNGELKGVPHETLFWRKLECADIREGKWKLIRVEGLGMALYNLDEDIGETRNLAKQMPERVASMAKKLMAWERNLMKPLWEEGEYWRKQRYKYHKAMFETGKPPGKKAGKK
jgi:arylsulfatase A-like enzyme